MSFVLSRDQIRAVDRIAIEEYGIPGVVLMENAGRGVADTIVRQRINGLVVICCGSGNNGGDGFVVARHLHIRGYEVRLIVWADPDRLRGDARINYQIAACMKLPMGFAVDFSEDQIGASLDDAEWIVDALLGTGAIGDPKPPISVAIERINQADAKRLAVDIPSGLDCDTGRAATPTIRADHTCTFFAEKPAMRIEPAQLFLGQVHLIDIGAPLEIALRIPMGSRQTPAGSD